MKRIIILLLCCLLVSLSVITGCSGSSSTVTLTTEAVTTTSTTSTATSTSTASPTPTPTATPDFRNINWGMSKAEVKDREKEGSLYSESDTQLAYTGIKINNLDVVMVYLFNKSGQVYEVNYGFLEKHTNPTAYIDDYNGIKTLLTSKYGAPKDDQAIWLNDLYKDDPGNWGMAVVTGDLKYYADWKNDPVYILINLQGDNYDATFRLMYEYEPLSDKSTGDTSGL